MHWDTQWRGWCIRKMTCGPMVLLPCSHAPMVLEVLEWMLQEPWRQQGGQSRAFLSPYFLWEDLLLAVFDTLTHSLLVSGNLYTGTQVQTHLNPGNLKLHARQILQGGKQEIHKGSNPWWTLKETHLSLWPFLTSHRTNPHQQTKAECTIIK